MKKNLLSLLMTIFAVVALSSCSDDNKNNTGVDAVYDWATVLSIGDNGCSFGVQQNQNSTPVTYTSTANLKDKVKVGQRVIIAYTMPDNRKLYTSGPINLYALNNGVINADMAVGKSTQYGGWSSESLRVLALSLTGDYLNFQGQLSYKNTPTRFVLVMDEETAGEKTPTLYLLFEADNSSDATSHGTYASFNISKLREGNKYDGFNVRVANSGGKTEFHFNLSAPTDIQPVD